MRLVPGVGRQLVKATLRAVVGRNRALLGLCSQVRATRGSVWNEEREICLFVVYLEGLVIWHCRVDVRLCLGWFDFWAFVHFVRQNKWEELMYSNVERKMFFVIIIILVSGVCLYLPLHL